MDVTIKMTGPLFDGGVPSKVHKVLEAAVQELIEMGEQRLDQVLKPRPGGVYLTVEQAGRGKASTGHYRQSIHGERHDLVGRLDGSKVIYGPWLEGVSSRNATTRFRGYSSFRLTGQWLQEQAPRIVQAHVKRLVGDLN